MAIYAVLLRGVLLVYRPSFVKLVFLHFCSRTVKMPSILVFGVTGLIGC
jgi:hypothetical protein